MIPSGAVGMMLRNRAVDRLSVDPNPGWLPTAVPSAARRFRVTGVDLREPVRRAGGVLVDAAPDVEIGALDDLRWDGAWVVVPLQGVVASTRPLQGARVRHRGERLLGAARLRAESMRVRHALARRGYVEADVVRWERGEPVYVPGFTRRPSVWSRAAWGRSAVVIARRPQSAHDSLLAEVVDQARRTGRSLRPETLMFGASGVIVVVADDGVLRVACDPGSERLAVHARALRLLGATTASSGALGGRIPTMLDSGTCGLSQWVLETRLPGTRSHLELSEPVVEDCLAFLVALFELRSPSARDRLPMADAAVVCPYLPERLADRVRALAVLAGARLHEAPRGRVHGDFWSGNLLVEQERLVGVTDWSATRSAGVPLLDLLHLEVSEHCEQTGTSFGDAVVTRVLVPFAAGQPSDLVVRYCERIGYAATSRELEATAIAYWLGRLAHSVRDPDATSISPDAPAWLAHNVTPVVDAIDGR